jgi:threonine dehydrogenase-like Zn-dependent dehydrogenase
VFGLGPIGQMSSAIAEHRGGRVIAVDLAPERLRMAEQRGIEIVNLEGRRRHRRNHPREDRRRGTDSVIDAVGMEPTARRSGRRCTRSLGCCRTPWPRR